MRWDLKIMTVESDDEINLSSIIGLVAFGLLGLNLQIYSWFLFFGWTSLFLLSYLLNPYKMEVVG